MEIIPSRVLGFLEAATVSRKSGQIPKLSDFSNILVSTIYVVINRICPVSN